MGHARTRRYRRRGDPRRRGPDAARVRGRVFFSAPRYPDLPINVVVDGIRKGRQDERDRRKREAGDRTDSEDSGDSAAPRPDRTKDKARAFRAADALLRLAYDAQALRPPMPADTTKITSWHWNPGLEAKDAYFYIFGKDGAPIKRAATPFDGRTLALYLTKATRLVEYAGTERTSY